MKLKKPYDMNEVLRRLEQGDRARIKGRQIRRGRGAPWGIRMWGYIDFLVKKHHYYTIS